jgi:hypothetical protein
MCYFEHITFPLYSVVHGNIFLLQCAEHNTCLCHFPLYTAHAYLRSSEHATYFCYVPLLNLVLSKSVVNGYGHDERGSIPASFLLDVLCSGIKWPQRKPDRRTTYIS